MPVTQALLDLLVCPVCHKPLRLVELPPENAIDCTGCHRRFPIQDGLPVLIADRATLPGLTPAPPQPPSD